MRVTGMARRDTYYRRCPDQRALAGDGQRRRRPGVGQPGLHGVPGATPSKIIAQLSKDGHLYLLDAATLGGANGQKVDFTVAGSGMSLHTTPARVQDRDGFLLRLLDDRNANMCPGGVSGRAVVAVRIAAANPPTPSIVWCAPMSGPTTGPIVTTTDGQADAIVWYMNDGRLMGVDGDTGASIYASATGNTCSGVRQWSSPIAVKGRIVAGGTPISAPGQSRKS